MALIKCPECGNEVSDKATACPKCGIEMTVETEVVCPECGNIIEQGECSNCGYNPENVEKKKKAKKKKVLLIVTGIVGVALLIVAALLIINANRGDKYVLEACKELAKDKGGLPNIEAIYVSEEVGDGSYTIDYVYQVYVEYSTGWENDAVLYVIDDKGKSYYITESSHKRLSCYLKIAELGITGGDGLFKPSDNWKKLSKSEVKKIEDKIN